MTGIYVEKADVDVLRAATMEFRHTIDDAFRRHLADYELMDFYPTPVSEFVKELQQLREDINRVGANVEHAAFPVASAPLMREVLSAHRLRLAEDIDRRRKHVLDADVLERLERTLDPCTRAMSRPWFRAAKQAVVPRLSEFFPIEDVESPRGDREGKPAPRRMYDEKFHILQAPSQFLGDLAASREASKIRGRTLAVAFVDIDDFKQLNKAKTETFVDRNVLPRFMRRLESHVYSRGYAYRQGGDEYLVLLNNVSQRQAFEVLDALRSDLASQKYPGIDAVVTVSIGLSMVAPTCHFTGREIEETAALAKGFAKTTGGKNCVATYEDEWFEKLVIAAPTPPPP